MTTKDYLNQISYYNKIIDNKLIETTKETLKKTKRVTKKTK